MRYINTIALLMLMILSASWNSDPISDSSARLRRARSKAEKSYECLAYAKSIRQYAKVFELNPVDPQATLRIADSYRMINDMENAAKWYGKAAESGFLTDKTDQLNYAHVLAGLERYEEADHWYKAHGEEGKLSGLIRYKREAIKNIEDFYADSMAYFVNQSDINSEYSDFGPAYTRNGIAFASARPSGKLFNDKYEWDNSYFLDIYYAESGKNPERISDQLNTKYHEGPAVYFDNDLKVIFTRNNYHQGKARESEDGVNKLKLYFAQRTTLDSKWSEPVELPFNNDNYSVGHPAISADGRTLWFASDMPGGFGGSDIYFSSLENGEWSQPQNMGKMINTPGDELFPFVHQEGMLYYASDGKPGLGGLDIYEASLSANVTPKNLGFPINTSSDDFALILSADGRSGYLSSNREGGAGSDDIYYFERYIYDVRVQMIHAKTGEPLSGTITGTFQSSGRQLSNEDGSEGLTFTVKRGQEVKLEAIKKGFENSGMRLMTTKLPLKTDSPYLIEIPMIPLEENPVQDVLLVENNGTNSQVIKLNKSPELYSADFETLKDELQSADIKVGNVSVIRNIYYDFDKSAIRKDAAERLDKVVALLKEYPEMRVELNSHTDVRGTIRYNDKLSVERSQSARSYLAHNGIAYSRIDIKSFGENELYVDCNDDCDEEKHQSNRRTEIRLILPE